jgi:hypothetical protein
VGKYVAVDFKWVVRLRVEINRIEMKEHGKYHFDFWRPFQAIRKAALDDNPATSPDLTWTPLISAPYPGELIGTPRARQFAHNRAADVLRQRTRGRLPDHEQLGEPRRAGDAHVRASRSAPLAPAAIAN